MYADLSRVAPWVEETLRYDTSSQILARTVSGDLTLYDTVIPDGDIVLLLPDRHTGTSACSSGPTISSSDATSARS